MTLKSNASDSLAGSVPLPTSSSTESKLKRDDWMLLEPTTPTAFETSPIAPQAPVIQLGQDTSFTEDYGESVENGRTLGGGVDFFSSLGTERKKSRPEKPDPSKVLCYLICFIERQRILILSFS